MSAAFESEVFVIDAAQPMVATLQRPQTSKPLGVVFITGGMQTRAGAHRQFLKLSHRFAAEGYASIRFDLPGLGDAPGEVPAFDENDTQIRAAVDALLARCPDVKTIALWGLCDGATAAAFYAPQDARVSALLLANPWVRSAQTEAAALVRSYYLQRFMSGDFWRKLFSGKVGVFAAIGGWLGNVQRARAVPSAENSHSLPTRFVNALQVFDGHLMCVLAGQDLTAQEASLALQARADVAVPTHVMPEADHTFSRADWHAEIEVVSLQLFEQAVISA